MADKELLIAFSDIVEKKVRAEIQAEIRPLKDDVHFLKEELQEVKGDIQLLKEELQGVKDDVRFLKEELQGVKGDIQLLKEEMQEVKGDIRFLKNEVRNIWLHLENVTDKRIDLLVENYVPAAKIFTKETARIDALQSDVDVLKKVVQSHSEKLNQSA